MVDDLGGKAGVNAFVDLTEAGESGLKPYAHMLADGAAHRRMAIRDAGVPRTAADMTAILDCIDGHLERGDVVYVHCWGGVGRTGTVVGCWACAARRFGRRCACRTGGFVVGVRQVEV